MNYQVAFIITLLFNICSAQNGDKKCECVPNNQCFPNLQLGGGGLDIRIVSGNSSTSPTPPCSSGLIQCCSECGVAYNITSAPNPGPGQGRYGSQPWQAVLLDNKFNYLGGGVLLDESNVLTAAHKVYEFRNTPASVIVRLGEWDAASKIKEPFNSTDTAVSKMFIHEQYKHEVKNLLNDVAVLRLATKVRYGPTVNPAINTACLPTAASQFNRCVVSGWGKDAFNGSYQAIIKEVEVPVVNNAECEKRLRTTRLGKEFVLDSNSFMCAGGEPGKDACVGDGGSPLMCKVGTKYQVAGLVAWGIGCANGDVPGVYVKVLSFLDFIEKSRKAAK